MRAFFLMRLSKGARAKNSITLGILHSVASANRPKVDISIKGTVKGIKKQQKYDTRSRQEDHQEAAIITHQCTTTARARRRVRHWKQ